MKLLAVFLSVFAIVFAIVGAMSTGAVDSAGLSKGGPGPAGCNGGPPPPPPPTNLILLITFHCCEQSIEVAKQVLELHFTLRTLFEGFFKDRCLDTRLKNTMECLLFAPLQVPTVQGYRAIYCRLIDPDPKYFFLADTLRYFMMVFDLWQLEEGTWPGLVIVIDMDTTCIGHITKLEVMNIKKLLYFLQEAMLVRLKGVHFLNAPGFMDKLMMLLKPFLKKTLLDMIRIHEVGDQSVYEYIPKEAFPKEEGGNYKEHRVIKEETLQRFIANADYFRQENCRRVDESKRINGSKSDAHNIFGIEGSFKKLDID